MNSPLYNVNPILMAVFLAVILAVTWLLGRAGGRWRGEDALHPTGARVADASMALMGLLLGFTFAMSLSKHDRRREMVVEDSNAIGDFYTCISVLNDPPLRAELQKVTRAYARQRLALANSRTTEAELNAALDEISASQNRMTELVSAAVEHGTPVAVPLVNTLNGVTSMNAMRLMAVRDRLPASVVGLLFLAAIVSIALLGWQQGAAKKSFPVSTLGFILLASAAVLITLDLNHPQRGFIRVSQEPLERLIASMK